MTGVYYLRVMAYTFCLRFSSLTTKNTTNAAFTITSFRAIHGKASEQLFSITLTLESSTHKAVPCVPYSQNAMTY